MENVSEVKAALDRISAEVRERVDAPITSMQDKIAEMDQRQIELEQRVLTARRGSDTADLQASQTFMIAADGQVFPVLARADRMAAHFPQGGEMFSIGDYVRANMGIRVRNDMITRGPALVPEFLSAQIIDDVRAKSRVIQAGAVTIPIDGPTRMARIIQDPTVYQHAEGQEDIDESQPDFEPVSFDPQAVVALVPLTNEVVQDSTNLDNALRISLGAAFASKLDDLCLATLFADEDIASGSEDVATWAGVMLAVGAQLAADMDVPLAWIANAVDYATRHGELATDSGAWLGAPALLRDMRDLPTSKLDPGESVSGNFSAFAIAARQQLQLEIIRFNAPKKYSHLLVAHARLDGYVLQPKLLYRTGDSE
jgi:hypothetical protein